MSCHNPNNNDCFCFLDIFPCFNYKTIGTKILCKYDTVPDREWWECSGYEQPTLGDRLHHVFSPYCY